jgi:hypothetical protein
MGRLITRAAEVRPTHLRDAIFMPTAEEKLLSKNKILRRVIPAACAAAAKSAGAVNLSPRVRRNSCRYG